MSVVSGHKFQFGHLHLTIETEPVDIDRNLDGHRRLADVTKQLVELLDSQRLAATWAVGDPAHSATTTLLTLSEIQHEVALLGDHHWLGHEAAASDLPTSSPGEFRRPVPRASSSIP